jgi:parvulin-like peptidyl-prolyl isomerase
MRRFVAFAALAGALTITACDGFGQAMTSHTDVLARAAGHELSIEQATNLLAPATRIPAQDDVVQAIADLWIDYTLMATAAAQDPTLANLNLDAIIEPYFNQQLVFKLRDEVIQVDTVFTDDQLRQMFEEEQPNAEVRARHILFRMPPDASPQVRTEVMQRAQQVQQQAAGGADFAQLASQHTEEPGGAERGGDLGYFGPGQMVQPFDEAAFRLQPGQVSELVETPFGVHIIKVEDKRLPDFGEHRDDFRAMMVQQRMGQAEEGYLTQLTDARQLEVQDGAVAIARELAQKPSTNLSRRAAQRPLVRYTNGGLTAGEYLVLMQQRPAAQRSQVAAASDEQLADWLRLLARDEILIEEARRLNLGATQQEQDSARRELREQLVQAARETGLLPVTPQGGETQSQAIQRQVMAFLQGIINGEQNVVPLGAIGFSLREQYGAEMFERSVPVVVRRVEERRPASDQGLPPGIPGQPPAGAMPPRN